MDTIREAFAFNLKLKRGKRTQAEFAEFLGLPLRTYQKIEAGNVPQRATMKQLTLKLGVSEVELVQMPGGAPNIRGAEHSNPEIAKSYSNSVKRMRQKAGINRVALAKRSGLPESLIEEIENGCDAPITVFQTLAWSLDCGVGDLVGEVEVPRRQHAPPPSRSSLLGEIIIALGDLNETQLNGVLTAVRLAARAGIVERKDLEKKSR